MKREIPLIAVAVFLLVMGFYSQTMKYAEAVSVVTVTFPAGTTTFDVSYAGGIFSNNNDTTAYVIGANGGVVYVWKKSGSGVTEDTIIANVTLTGSTSARAIEVSPNINAIYAVTNDKFWKLNSNPTVQLERAESIANNVRKLVFADNGNMYFCTNDVFGTINQVTLAPTTLYTDAGTNGILDCAFDTTNGFAYLAGDTIGGGGGKDVLKVSLSTFTVVDSTGQGADFFFGVCHDSNENIIWLTASSANRVTKLDSDLNLIANVTVGTTPRFCGITDDDQARRLYVSNEGTDNVSIVDIDANVVISTQTTCNQGVTTPRTDVKRLFNTTNYYQTCPDPTNSIIVDDTISQEIPDGITDTITLCYIVQGTNQQFCQEYQVDEDGNIILDSVIGGVNPRNITTTSGELFCSLGITDCNNPDIQTNGTGMFMLLILVVISYAFVVAIHHFAHSPLSQIHPLLVLLIGVIDITIAFFLGWIPDYVFYTVIVLLIGLGGFGLYRVIRGV